MCKIKKLLRDRRGVTLAELIVTMAIFALITAATAALLVPTLSSYAKANELAELNSLLDTLSTELTGAMSASDHPPDIAADKAQVTLYAAGSSTSYYIQNGILYRQPGNTAGGPVLQPGYYKNKQLSLEFSYTQTTTPPSAILTTKLRLTLRDGGTLQRSFDTMPILLNQTP